MLRVISRLFGSGFTQIPRQEMRDGTWTDGPMEWMHLGIMDNELRGPQTADQTVSMLI